MKYFYRDPLAAAWMAKHFGMTFTNGDSSKSACEVAGATLSAMPFEIHPDSLHLLEPQVGDVIEHDDDEDDRFFVINYEPKLYAERHGIKKIIQREGIAFHWPESEA